MGIRVAVDAMGGDFAPRAIVRGALQALREQSDLELVLVGDEGRVRDELGSVPRDPPSGRLRIVHASQSVAMEESPLDALKTKKDSSLARMADLAAAGVVDATVSAGNTGAYAAASQLRLRPLSCVSRPGIAVTIPSFEGPFVLCDVGANIHARPRHLYQYAVMATLYAQRVLGIESPRVALISIGEERGKGTELTKQAYELLLEDKSIRFVGNAEGRELFENHCDVGICDGFVGNVVLKFVEGLAEGLFKTMAREFDDEAPELKTRFNQALDRVWQRHDYSHFGGAPLLGINGVCIICHGRSRELAICNAVKVARRFVEQGFNDEITARLS